MTARATARSRPSRRRTRPTRGSSAWRCRAISAISRRSPRGCCTRASRHAGRPKFTLAKLVALALDGLVGFSEAPTRPAGGLGLLGLFLAGLGLAGVLANGLLGSGWPPGWAWVGLAVVISGSAQLL